MTVSVQLRARHLLGAAVIVAAGMILAVWWASPAGSQESAPQAVDSFAFVARADNPVDALAASSVAGQLGAPVYLTGTDSLDDQAAQGLSTSDPHVVVLAGGTAALSQTVEQQIAELLPDAQIVRKAGFGRTETARLINELTVELGVERPVLAGATVAGDVGIDGALTVNGTDLGATLGTVIGRVDTLESELEAAQARIDTVESDNVVLAGRVDTLESELEAAQARIDTVESDNVVLADRVDTLESDLAAANTSIGQLEATLDGVSRNGDRLTFSGMNIQLVNGQGSTDTSNGLGNLVIGYNAQRPTPVSRTGSHYLIVGDRHGWTAHGGIVTGLSNTATGNWASVTGGQANTASGFTASVTGGAGNAASGNAAAVTGGELNTASGSSAAVTGGASNTASGSSAAVTGGQFSTASGSWASVTGGHLNTASWTSASVTGGRFNNASASYASVVGGEDGAVTDQDDSRIGDTTFTD